MRKFYFLSALVMMLAMSMSLVSCGDDDPGEKKGDDKPTTTTVYVSYSVKCNRDNVNCDFEQYSLADEIDKLETNAAKIIANVMTAQGGKADSDYSSRFSFSGKSETEVQAALNTAFATANTSLAEVETKLGGKFSYEISSSTASYSYCKTFLTKEITLKQALFATFKSGDFKYQVLPNNHVALITEESLDSYDKSTYSGDITVPSTVTDNGTTYTVTTIGPRAFYASSDKAPITSISLPSTITTICMDAFEYNYKLTKINIPGSVKTFIKGIYTTTEMFDGKALTEVTLGEGLTTLPDNAFSNNKFTSINIPGTMTKVPHACFCPCTNLVNVTMGSGVKEIGSYAFSQTGVTNLDFIPATVTTIGESAFSSCSSLATIELKEGVTTIGNAAFEYTPSLKKVTIPSTVTSIGYVIFNGSKCAVEEIHMKGSTPAKLSAISTKDTFYGIPSTCKIYVPSASVDAYKKADIWSNYASQIVGE